MGTSPYNPGDQEPFLGSSDRAAVQTAGGPRESHLLVECGPQRSTR